jgi:4-amino-4-deoxy-L-arabinose transferase-like glycosyltransferase
VTHRTHVAIVAAACVLPRLGALLLERGNVLADFTEKSDDFARTFVETGTYGFLPGDPSAYTQPLYGFFLVPLYAVGGRHWLVVGLAQIALALATALLVYGLGRRYLSPTAGALAAVAATLSPYLVWHDVHVNREIVDQPLAVGIVFLALLLAERPRLGPAVALGAVCGLAILGNARLAAVPLLVAAFTLVCWRGSIGRRELGLAFVVVTAAALTVTPWIVRNSVSVGCAVITTDARALWKANNEQTYDLLASGQWIDAVEGPPGAPPTPEEAFGIYREHGTRIPVDECEQMRYYQELTEEFLREHPGEKARLAAQAVGMLWDPRSTQTEGRPGADGVRDTARELAMPLYLIAVLAVALPGLWLVPRRLATLALALLAYQTLTAMLFVGATRYRVPWDFLLALAGAATVVWLLERFRSRRG